jgi:hypothetical protein
MFLLLFIIDALLVMLLTREVLFKYLSLSSTQPRKVQSLHHSSCLYQLSWWPIPTICCLHLLLWMSSWLLLPHWCYHLLHLPNWTVQSLYKSSCVLFMPWWSVPRHHCSNFMQDLSRGKQVYLHDILTTNLFPRIFY